MAGQHRAGEVVKAPRTRLAPIPLPVSLGLVKAIADYGTATAGRAADTLRPAMLAHQGETLGIVDQRREVDQIRGGHDATGSSRGTVRYPAPAHLHRPPPGTLPRPGSITPVPDKSQKLYRSIEELQADLDVWVAEYNKVRPHQGRWCYGKTPMQTFLDAVPLARDKMIAT